MITDWAMLNLSSNENKEWKSNKIPEFYVTLPHQYYTPHAWIYHPLNPWVAYSSSQIQTVEFQNQQAVPSLTFWPVDRRPHPFSDSMLTAWVLRPEQPYLSLSCQRLPLVQPRCEYINGVEALKVPSHCKTLVKHLNQLEKKNLFVSWPF